MSTPSRQHPSRRHPARSLRRAVRSSAVAAGLVVLASSCSGPNPFQAAASATTVATATTDGAAPDASIGDNEFLPSDADLGDCVGTLQRPGCGSDARGGWRQYLTMGVLVLGLAFVGWRISRGVRARDAVVNAVVDEATRPPTDRGSTDA